MINAARNLLEKHPSAEWLIPLVFCLILLAQVLFSVRQMSEQADESTHLYAGYRVLKCSDYTFGREHPPLAKMLAAISLLWSNPPIDCSPRDARIDGADYATRWLYSQDNWWRLLTQARIAASFFSVTLCLAVWIAARRMFGLAVAVVSGRIRGETSTLPLHVEALYDEYSQQAAFACAALLAGLALVTLALKSFIESRHSREAA